nr:hypothetical protein [Mucilaginibacter sp. FT3.2]
MCRAYGSLIKRSLLRVTTSSTGKNIDDILKKIVIARRYDEAIPYLQGGFAQLLCKPGIASYLAMTVAKGVAFKKTLTDNQHFKNMCLGSA